MKKFNFNIIVFLLTIFTLSSVNFLKFGNSDTGELENRNLHSKPELTFKSLFSGEFSREYEDYYSDHFMYRDKLVGISSIVNDIKGLGNNNAMIIAHSGDNTAEANIEPEEENISTEKDNKEQLEDINKESNTPKEAPLEEDSPKEEESGSKIGSMLILKDRAMEIYSFSEDSGKSYAEIINRFEEKLQHKVKVYSLLVPTQIEFVENDRYKGISSSQRSVIENVNKSLNKNIIPVNAYDALSKNRDKYLYFKTDHHWTALGAYYAYTAFAKTIGEIPVPLEKYKEGEVKNFLGSTYSATLNKRLQNNPDTIHYYKPFTKHEYKVYYEGALKMNIIDLNHATKKNKYRIFLSGDRPLGKIVTEVKNNKKILIIKDSYGNALIPFLLPHYNEIYIADPRQFKDNIVEFTKKNDIHEVLFLNYVPAANMKKFSDLLVNIMNK